MKKAVLFLSLSFFALLIIPLSVRAEELVDRLQGRILLQTESKGEAWYVNPSNKQRAYLGRPEDVFRIMREFGLGVKEAELNSYLETSFPKRLAGRIMLNVEGLGEAYYVSPDDLKGHFLGSPSQAFKIVREKAMGITNNNINKIKVIDTPANKAAQEAASQQSATPVPTVDSAPGDKNASETPKKPTQDEQPSLPNNDVNTTPVPSVNSGICSAWRYREWSNCTGGYQKREVVEAFPAGCSGGQPTIIKNCGNDVVCSSWTYTDWSPCNNGTQTRSVVLTSPDGCVGGQPVLTQTCDMTSVSPYSPYQFSYVREMGPQYDPHVRILFLGEPNENIKIKKIPVTAYYGYGTMNDTLPPDLSYSLNYTQGGEAKSVVMSRLNNRNFVFDAGTAIPLSLDDNNSVTIKANKDGYSAINDITKWEIWDYSVNKPVWLGN